MSTARARHILVPDESKANSLLSDIKEGNTDFADAAKEHSTCPSGKSGGDLGQFSQGDMVPEFDKVIFDDSTPLNEAVGPVKTQFGYHLIEVTNRG